MCRYKFAQIRRASYCGIRSCQIASHELFHPFSYTFLSWTENVGRLGVNEVFTPLLTFFDVANINHPQKKYIAWSDIQGIHILRCDVQEKTKILNDMLCEILTINQ